MTTANQRRFIGVQSDAVGSNNAISNQDGKETAVGVQIRAPWCGGQNGSLTKAIATALARAVVIAGSIARLTMVVMAAFTSDIGGAHPVTFPAFEERACQHKCCHHNGNEPTTGHCKYGLR